jgi:hypothetical protein
MVMNDMVKDLTEDDLDLPKQTLTKDKNDFGSFGEPLVTKIEEPHLPKDTKPGLTDQTVENRNVSQGNLKKGRRGPLYSSRSSKRIADE